MAATTTARRFPVVPVALVAIGIVMAVAAVLVTIGGDGGEQATGGGEIFLEAASSTGADPFTPAVDPATPASSVVAQPVAGPLPAPPAGVVPTSGTAPPPGSPPYGGSGDDRVCDREQLIRFLNDQPDRARAWAGVLGIDPATIPTYVRSLTPTVLLYDTRVTNHGFANGGATTLQSVLQAGTAVLVDAQGNPVVRCKCGNPLTPAAPVSQPTLVGTPWPGFDPAALVSVSAGVTVTVTIQVSGASSTTPPSTVGTTTPSSTSSGQPTVTANPNLTDDDRQAAAGLVAVVAECTGGAPVTVIDVVPLEGVTGGFTVTLDVGGTPMQFVYEPATGTITEGDRASAELIASCGVL